MDADVFIQSSAWERWFKLVVLALLRTGCNTRLGMPQTERRKRFKKVGFRMSHQQCKASLSASCEQPRLMASTQVRTGLMNCLANAKAIVHVNRACLEGVNADEASQSQLCMVRQCFIRQLPAVQTCCKCLLPSRVLAS